LAAGAAGLQFWADDLLLADVTVPLTGHRYAWTSVSASLPAAAEGIHDLRVMLRGDVRLSTFRFSSADGVAG